MKSCSQRQAASTAVVSEASTGCSPEEQRDYTDRSGPVRVIRPQRRAPPRSSPFVHACVMARRYATSRGRCSWPLPRFSGSGSAPARLCEGLAAFTKHRVHDRGSPASRTVPCRDRDKAGSRRGIRERVAPPRSVQCVTHARPQRQQHIRENPGEMQFGCVSGRNRHVADTVVIWHWMGVDRPGSRLVREAGSLLTRAARWRWSRRLGARSRPPARPCQ
jgi:hypothetical protein